MRSPFIAILSGFLRRFAFFLRASASEIFLSDACSSTAMSSSAVRWSSVSSCMAGVMAIQIKKGDWGISVMLDGYRDRIIARYREKNRRISSESHSDTSDAPHPSSEVTLLNSLSPIHIRHTPPNTWTATMLYMIPSKDPKT